MGKLTEESVSEGVELNSTTPLTSTINELISLDVDGNAILDIEELKDHTTVEFHISTKVLGLASPVFSRMFGPHFEEGHRVRRAECPHIKLHDDDPHAMETILRMLHYQGNNQLPAINAEMLATVAVHCDKYDCINALNPWMSYWLTNLEKTTNSPEDFGFLLLTTYLLDDSKQFKELSAKAMVNLTRDFSLAWKDYTILAILPETVKHQIIIERKKILDHLHATLQSVEAYLRGRKEGYEIQRLVCMSCGRTLPAEAKKCHPCNNTLLHQKLCTSDSRIAEYFAILAQEELWPSVTPFDIYSVSDLVFRFDCTRKDLKHSCAAGARCPLETELNILCNIVRRSRENIRGLCLRCIKMGRESVVCKCT